LQRRYGSPETLDLAEVERPAVASGEALVRVHAAALNPTDYVVMRGLLRPQTGWRRPRQAVRGFDVAGVVEAVGSEVVELAPGDAVFGSCRGSFAEYAVGAAEKLVPKPERLSFEQAAGIAVAGTMALEALRDHARLRALQRVAIADATGGVGSFAVQIAKAYGAHVTAVCRTQNVDLARSLGADRVFDYTREDYCVTTGTTSSSTTVAAGRSVPCVERCCPAGSLSSTAARTSRWPSPAPPLGSCVGGTSNSSRGR
jgi:NADPH:quinone reductase-like Zn-dependent oxidoreductase